MDGIFISSYLGTRTLSSLSLLCQCGKHDVVIQHHESSGVETEENPQNAHIEAQNKTKFKCNNQKHFPFDVSIN